MDQRNREMDPETGYKVLNQNIIYSVNCFSRNVSECSARTKMVASLLKK